MECQECGMTTEKGEYHPYAACLMFKASGKGDTVRMNLKAVGDQQSKKKIRAVKVQLAKVLDSDSGIKYSSGLDELFKLIDQL